MEKVLIITYYWPPSGGAGVQRWVKLSKYLERIGIQPYILTVDENYASYTHIDESLNKDVSNTIQVYKTRSFEPIRIYSKLVGIKNVPTAGFSNIDKNKFSVRLVNWLRSNLFIPDPRKGWNKHAIKKAKEIISVENIKTIITTSPPHSTQLIGLELKKELGVNWIADFRDPWTDIYYYKSFGHSKRSNRIDRQYEKSVLKNADQIICVSKGVEELLSQKVKKDSSSFHLVYNGFDPEDFEIGEEKKEVKTFNMLYAGSMSDVYEPQVLFDALHQVSTKNPDLRFKINLIGEISNNIISYLANLNLPFNHKPRISHQEIIKNQKAADLLLLIIPHVENEEGILTGKLYEYIGSGKPILCLSSEKGEAAKIIREGNFGVVFDRTKGDQIVHFMEEILKDFAQNVSRSVDPSNHGRFSREAQAEEIKKIIISLLKV